MAIRTVVTRGFGNGTFSGTIALVVTRGYSIGVPSLGPGGTGVPTVGRTVLIRSADLEYLRQTQQETVLTDADLVYLRGTQDGDLP